MNAVTGFIPSYDFVPQTPEEWESCLRDPMWRICSGQLYKIMIKGDDETQPGTVLPFKPNANQMEFLRELHYRNVILKARQLGFTTLIAILWLDHALWVPNQRCGIIAHTLTDAQSIFRDKVRFAYENLPEPLLQRFPLTKDAADELLFAHNNSSIRVAVSMRSGTIHRLHISEMGKIAAKHPDKAKEIVTGSLPTVPANGIAIIESTAEGRGGEFYELSNVAERNTAKKRKQGESLLPSEFKFHFFPWWKQPEYRLPPDQARRVRISSKEHEYFDKIELAQDVEIDLAQRAWYITLRDNTFRAAPEDIWREFPSTSAECWQASTDGKYLAKVLMIARREGRIGIVPYVSHVPVNSFWDLGAGDETAIWLHQRIGLTDRWLRYYEASGEGYLHFILWMEKQGYLWGTHFLPHDASHRVQDIEQTTSPLFKLQQARPHWKFVVVPRVQTIQHGVELLRNDFTNYWFHEEGTKEGLEHLEAYSREFNTRLQCWHDYPRHDQHSHAADALRQKAQAYEFPHEATASEAERAAKAARSRRRASGMTA